MSQLSPKIPRSHSSSRKEDLPRLSVSKSLQDSSNRTVTRVAGEPPAAETEIITEGVQIGPRKTTPSIIRRDDLSVFSFKQLIIFVLSLNI